MSPHIWNHLEAAAQIVTGSVIAIGVCMIFHLPVSTALSINIVLTVILWVKTYYVRRVFDYVRTRHGK